MSDSADKLHFAPKYHVDMFKGENAPKGVFIKGRKCPERTEDSVKWTAKAVVEAPVNATIQAAESTGNTSINAYEHAANAFRPAGKKKHTGGLFRFVGKVINGALKIVGTAVTGIGKFIGDNKAGHAVQTAGGEKGIKYAGAQILKGMSALNETMGQEITGGSSKCGNTAQWFLSILVGNANQTTLDATKPQYSNNIRTTCVKSDRRNQSGPEPKNLLSYAYDDRLRHYVYRRREQA